MPMKVSKPTNNVNFKITIMENNKWIVDKSFAYTLHETGRFVKGKPELCNKFYFRVYPDYTHGITDEDAAKVVSELMSAKEERDSLIEHLENLIDKITKYMPNVNTGNEKQVELYFEYHKAKELLSSIK